MVQHRRIQLATTKVVGIFLLGACSASPVAAQAQALPRILADAATKRRHPLPDFSYAGYRFGLGRLPTEAGTVVNVVDHGALPDDAIDDSRAVLEAVAAANKFPGRVTLRFPAGRFILSEIVRIERGDFVLEGAGSAEGGTELHFPRPLSMVDTTDELDELREYLIKEKKLQVEKDTNLNRLFSEYSWSGGFIRTGPAGSRPAAYLPEKDVPLPVLANVSAGRAGERTLRLERAAKLKAGQVVQLQWFPVSGQNSSIIRSMYGNTDLKIGSHHWSFPSRPLVTQATRIERIDGNRILIGDPLLHDISASQPAVMADWRHLENVGIQGLRFTFPDSPWFGHHMEQGYNAIYFTGVFDGWVRDVSIHNADAGILTYDSASATYRDVVITGNRRSHYAVHVGNAHNILVTGLSIRSPIVHSLSVNTQSTRAVFQRAEVFQEPVLDQHAGANHQNLFDQITLRLTPRRLDGVPTFDLWNGSGASYWEPGHGRYNTTWNLNVVVEGEARPGETVLLRGVAEGPDARVVGVSGNRPFRVDYRPAPYMEAINAPVAAAPSLYDYQLARRQR